MRASLNHIFRTVWSEALGTWIAVSELTKAKRADSSSSAQPQGVVITSFNAIAVALAACFSLPALANPQGATVINGSATLNQNGNTLTVTNSPNAIINWQSFSIGANEITHFAQQSAASSVLNRVIGAAPSQLLGSLTSNGRVFLINPNGILVGPGANINVGAFVASTLALSNNDFLAGRLNFTAPLDANGNPIKAGDITNQGNITTPEGGHVYLAAPNISNFGNITSPKGEVILAAGDTVTLIDSATPGVTVQVTGSANAATNLGQIVADSGRIGIVAATIRNSGIINASSMVSQGGRVLLKASNTTIIDSGSQIGATSTAPTNTTTPSNGGEIQILGNQVAVNRNTTIDASGTDGGGIVLIGGDAHGSNPNVQNSQLTFIDANASIKANATQNGNGGKVVVWSDKATQFSGNISARGGVNGGNGGWVETSGKQWLNFSGLVDTTAPKGNMGSLLLDPTDITIVAAPSVQSATVVNTTGTFTDPTTVVSTILNTTLQTQLAASNVTVSTASLLAGTGNITVAAPITWTTANTLTLSASNAILLNASITGTVGGLNLQAPGGIPAPTMGTAISVNTLEVFSAGVVALTGMNQVNTLAANVINTASTFTFENAKSTGLTIGTVGATTGVSAAGGATIWQYTSGGITVNNNVTSTTGIAKLGVASGTGGVTIAPAATVSGTSINVYTSGGAIVLNGTLTTGATGGGIVVGGAGSGSITEAVGGVINTMGLLTTTSIGGTTLGGANTIDSFTASNTTSGAISLTNTATWVSPLTVTGISNTAASGGITLSSAGAITQTAAISTTGLLTTSSVGGTTLNFANAVGSFSATNTTSGDITFTNNAAFTASGISNTAAGGGILLTDTLANTAITNPTAAISTNNGAITLIADKMSLAVSTGTINAGTGGVTLQNTTAINAINVGSTVDTTAATLELSSAELATITTGLLTIGSTRDSGAITVSAPVTLARNTSLINATGGIAINGAITGGTNNLTLTTTGAITQTGAISTTGLLTTSSGTGTTLNSANAVSSFSASNSATGNIALTNAASLAIGSAGVYNNAATGDVLLTTTGAASDITASVPKLSYTAINTTNGNVTLTSGRDVLLGNGADGMYADIYANGTGKNVAITANRDVSVNNFSFVNSSAGNVTLTATTGNISIHSSVNTAASWVGAGTAGTGGIVTLSAVLGSVLAPAAATLGDIGGGYITTGTGGSLVVTAKNGITLTDANNAVSNFSATNTTTGDIILKNTGALTVNGISNASTTGNISLIDSGAITVASAVSAYSIAFSANGIALNSTLSAVGSATDNAWSNINLYGSYSNTTANNGIAGNTVYGTIMLDANEANSVSTGNFVNNVGVGVLTMTGAGSRWLAHSANPALDVHGGLVANFEQYSFITNGAAGSSTVTGTGNGFLYAAAAPVVTTTAVATPVVAAPAVATTAVTAPAATATILAQVTPQLTTIVQAALPTPTLATSSSSTGATTASATGSATTAPALPAAAITAPISTGTSTAPAVITFGPVGGTIGGATGTFGAAPAVVTPPAPTTVVSLSTTTPTTSVTTTSATSAASGTSTSGTSTSGTSTTSSSSSSSATSTSSTASSTTATSTSDTGSSTAPASSATANADTKTDAKADTKSADGAAKQGDAPKETQAKGDGDKSDSGKSDKTAQKEEKKEDKKEDKPADKPAKEEKKESKPDEVREKC